MENVWLSVEVLFAIALLWKCADWFVDGAAGLAEYAGVPHMLIGLVLVSLATTAPELAASLLAALRGNPEMALGNAIGSVIVDDTVALGLGAVLAPVALAVDPRLLRKSGIFLFGACVILAVLSMDGSLSRWEGGLLVALFVGHVTYTLVSEMHRRKRGGSEDFDEADLENDPEISVGRAMWRFALGVPGVLIGSHFLLEGAIGMGRNMGMPEYAVGLTIVAIGTSVPEIATVAASALKGKGAIGIGNILGADILNICWVAGLSATVKPLSADTGLLRIGLVCMMAAVAAMLLALWTGHRLSRNAGFLLLFLYLLYLGNVFGRPTLFPQVMIPW